MIVYLDSSAIVSLYLDEVGRHDAVRAATTQADVVAASGIAYVEVRAALARASRDGRLQPSAYQQVLADFHRDWPAFVRVAVSEALIIRSGELADSRALRGYDAVQLAAALTVRDETGDRVMFCAWDDTLRAAASDEGLTPAGD